MPVLLDTPPRFSFRRTVFSHGWCTLSPFEAEDRGRSLSFCTAIAGGGAYRVTLKEAVGGVVVEIAGSPPAPSRRRLVAAARRVLGLGLDLSGFHDTVRRDPALRWIADSGSGRLLRGPSAFEDLVKLVLTTNCSWSLTTKMVGNLVTLYGEEAEGGGRAFPTPERLAQATEAELRDRVRAGYRAPYLAALARAVASGRIDPESWDDPSRDATEIRREMLRLPGVGPYVAENLLKFQGRPDGLALDSWMRAKYARMFHGGRSVTDRAVRRRFASLGPWAGLAIWFVLTRDWLDGEEPSPVWDTLT